MKNRHRWKIRFHWMDWTFEYLCAIGGGMKIWTIGPISITRTTVWGNINDNNR